MKSAPAARVTFRPIAIKALDWVTYRSGLQRRIKRSYGGAGSILMWHSVVEDPRDFLLQDIRSSTSFLESTLAWCRTNKVEVVSIADALQRLKDNNPQRFVVMTFDDGYRDNLTAALPLFEKFDFPITIYPTVGLVTQEAYYWWGGLVELVKRESVIDIDGLGRLPASSSTEKAFSLGVISRWIEADTAQRREALRRPFVQSGVDLKALMAEHILSAAEIRRLAQHPLVTIGSHALSHTYLRNLSPADLRREVVESKLWLEEVTQQPVEHFSYPHGDSRACGPLEAAAVRDAGYKSAISTRRGNLFNVHADAPFLLPRGAVNPRRETVASLEAQIAGLPRYLASRSGTPIDPETISVTVDS